MIKKNHEAQRNTHKRKDMDCIWPGKSAFISIQYLFYFLQVFKIKKK